MPCAIITCSCKSEGQDKLYGKGMRLANSCKKKKENGDCEWRCTVCKKETGKAVKELR